MFPCLPSTSSCYNRPSHSGHLHSFFCPDNFLALPASPFHASLQLALPGLTGKPASCQYLFSFQLLPNPVPQPLQPGPSTKEDSRGLGILGQDAPPFRPPTVLSYPSSVMSAQHPLQKHSDKDCPKCPQTQPCLTTNWDNLGRDPLLPT